MLKSWVLIVGLIWIMGSTAVEAADLMPTFALESTQVLPLGVRNPRFLNLLVSIDSKFSADGSEEALGVKLNKVVTWQDVVDARSEEADKNLIKGTLAKEGIPYDGSPGGVTGVVRSFVNVKVPVLAYGVTDKFTLAAIVPIVRADVSVDTGFVKNAQGEQFVNAICDTSPDKCNEAATKLNNATSEKLSRLGYEPLQSQVYNGVGDAQLVGKYLWYQDETQGFGTKLGVTVPTGRTWNPDKVLDVPTGDGRYKVGFTVNYDRYLVPASRWNVSAGYSLLMPHSIVKRLPTSDIDSLSSDKEDLQRQLADQATVGSTVDYRFSSLGLTVTTGYTVQYQAKGRYKGSATDDRALLRYALLNDLEPAQVLQSVVAGMGFSTVEWFRAGEFALPFQFNVVYSQPVAGRNTSRSGLLAGEMVMFF